MLRIGLMVDSLSVDAWIYRIVEDIRKSGFADVVFMIENTPEPRKPRKSRRELIKAHWKRTLYNRYSAWDRARNNFENDASEQKDLSPLVDDVTRLRVEPIRKGFTDRFAEEDLEQIRAAKLDVLFRFGFRIIRGPILDTARFGVWSFHHDDNLEYRGGPHLFWEIYEKNPVSGSILQILTDSLDGGRVIYRSHSSTNLISQARNRNEIVWKTSEFAMRRLYDLHTRGIGYIEALPTYNEENTYDRGIYHAPDTPQMLYFLAGQIYRRIRLRLTSVIRGKQKQWFIAIRKRSTAPFYNTSNYRLIVPPRDRFYADPFLFEFGGSQYLFYEDLQFATDRAHISCIEVRSDGSLSEPVAVLTRPYHLSYPFVFEHKGEIYMIPETKDNATVELYKATEFPHKWDFVSNILDDVFAVDATIHNQDGKLWMFVGLSNGKSSTSDELSIFQADQLTGPWKPHPLNPVISDVRRARPAGNLFYEDGKLIRPSQDCAKCYGHSLNFSEVVVLNETEYEERPVAKIMPEWLKNNLGTHHYSRTDEFEVLDGKFSIK